MSKCRICLSMSPEFINIFQKGRQEEYTIAQMFTECSGIEVKK